MHVCALCNCACVCACACVCMCGFADPSFASWAYLSPPSPHSLAQALPHSFTQSHTQVRAQLSLVDVASRMASTTDAAAAATASAARSHGDASMHVTDHGPGMHGEHPVPHWRPDLVPAVFRDGCVFRNSPCGVDENLLLLLHGLGDRPAPFAGGPCTASSNAYVSCYCCCCRRRAVTVVLILYCPSCCCAAVVLLYVAYCYCCPGTWRVTAATAAECCCLRLSLPPPHHRSSCQKHGPAPDGQPGTSWTPDSARDGWRSGVVPGL